MYLKSATLVLGKAFLLQLAFITIVQAQVSVPQTNLIANGDFMSRDPQQRPLRWVVGLGLQTAVISAMERRTDRKDDQSLKMTDTSEVSSLMVRTEKIIANPGTIYLATAWAKVKRGTPASFSIEFWDQNNKVIAKQSSTPEFVVDGNWKEQKITLKAPDKCTHVTLAITTGVKEKSLSFWDDVSLTPQIEYNPKLKKGVHELFLDDYRIEKTIDVERVIHPAKKSRPLINPTEPWEGNAVYIYGTVIKDEPAGSGYQMWYTSYIDENYYLCYATSKDGINWVKPKLGLIDYKGSKQNNICKFGGGTLVYDPLDKDPAKRFKMMTFDGSKEKFGYGVHFSPDGLNWTAYANNPVLDYGDVSNVAYDKEKGLFIATTKQRMLVSNTSVTPGKNDRKVFLSVSKDFINWAAPDEPNSKWTLAVEGDAADDMLVMSNGGIESNVYGMTVHPYEGIYVGMPWYFDIKTYATGTFAVTGDGKIQPQLASSRDLRHWSRPNRTPLIPLGKAGSWDDGTLYTASTLQVTDSNISVYYGAMNLPHGGDAAGITQYARIAKAEWRRDGFASFFNGGDDVGKINTKALTFDGSQLKVNVNLRKGGYLKVEILDEEGNTLKGFDLAQANSVTENQLAQTVTWKTGTSLKSLAGKTVKLRFHLNNGDLYSYWFE